MFNKLLWEIIPACVTFGPLFMTRIAGTAGPRHGKGLEAIGLAMLVLGLVGICRLLAAQQKAIRDLETRCREHDHEA
jgi:hypothetical protein